AQMNNGSFFDDLYFTQWYTYVTAILPPVFRDLTSKMPDFQPFRSAVLAISASYLAHVESSVVYTNYHERKTQYIPQYGHKYRSLEYYGRGVRELMKDVSISDQRDLHHVLATSLLFHYFEMDSGSLIGVVKHMEFIDRMVSTFHKELNSTQTGQKLLSTWMSLRSLVVNRRLSSGVGSKKALNNADENNRLDCLVFHAVTPYDTVLKVLCDSLLTARTIILDWCVCRGSNLTTEEKRNSAFQGLLEQNSLPKIRPSSTSKLISIDEVYWNFLKQQRTRLDEWHSKLDISELPIDSFTDDDSSFNTSEELRLGMKIYPLKFYTHETAMNYAYYATAQILSSQRIFERIASTNRLNPLFTWRDYPWEKLLLRITAGLDLADCIYKNTFNIGILSLLCFCAAWCPHFEVVAWIEEWIRRLEEYGVAVEDGMPLNIMKRIINMILKKKQSEQDLLMVSILDSEYAEKGDLYQSDFQILAAVCGKDRRTGKLYHDVVYVP
ncbi:hypothetical protein F5884DRAFT_649369, partial [Xylogone sp. PMI_703]